MKHADIRQKLSAYLDDAVSSEERVIIEEHLGSCRICTHALKDLTKTVDHLKNLEEFEPPAWMARKILNLLDEEAEKKAGMLRRIFFPFLIKLPVQAIALVLITVTGYLLFRTVQPQMGLLEPPAREEYRGRVPEAPPPSLPSAAPMKKALAKEKTGGKVHTSKQMAQKQLHPAREAGVLATAQPPAAVVDTPLSSANKAVPSLEHSLEVMKKVEVPTLPSPKAEKSMQFPDLTADESKMGKRSSYPLMSKSVRAKPETPFSLNLETREISLAGREIEKEVLRLGGRIVSKEPPVNATLFTALIEGEKIREFITRLRLFGVITEKGSIPDGVGKLTEIIVVIDKGR